MEVVTFLTKIQKSEGNSTTLKNWIKKLEGKPTTLKNWIQKMEGNSTTPKNCVLTNFLNERSKIFCLFFSLIGFWIFVRNEYCLTSYYQWLEPGNGSSSCCYWLYPASITILDCNSNYLALYHILSLIAMSTINPIWHPTTNGWNQWMAVVVRW